MRAQVATEIAREQLGKEKREALERLEARAMRGDPDASRDLSLRRQKLLKVARSRARDSKLILHARRLYS